MDFKQIKDAATALADKLDAAVYVYSGGIDGRGQALLLGQMQQRTGPQRKNALLLLTTSGGLANSAYKIAKQMQMAHEKFSVFVPSYCKSAGTLVTLGCHELYMSDTAELGPLDVQKVQLDEIGRRKSGLVVRTAFEGLATETLDLFERIMLGIKIGSGGSVSFDTAARIATGLTSGVMAPVYGQISPETLGNDLRDLNVASKYGELLIAESGNISFEGVTQLVSGYPSHDFVIDRDEAQKLFNNVSSPTPEMEALENALGRIVYAEAENHVVFRLDDVEDDVEGERDVHDPEASSSTEHSPPIAELDEDGEGTSRSVAGSSGSPRSDGEQDNGQTIASEAAEDTSRSSSGS